MLVSAKPECLVEDRSRLILNLLFGHSDARAESFPLNLVGSHFCRGELPPKTFVAFHSAVAVVAKDDEVRSVVIGRVTVRVMNDDVLSLFSTKAAGVPVGHHQGECNRFGYGRSATHLGIVPLEPNRVLVYRLKGFAVLVLDYAS